MALAPGSRVGPYEIKGPLGAGGMGEVYRAHDTRLGRDVAIKVLSSRLSTSPEARARFEREARAISQLNHPHICTLHDVGRQEGTDYLVMELLEGETLARRLEKGPLPLPQALRLGIEIAEALDVAHRAGVVHRDLKPGNVMLTKNGAKLMDFGLARPAGGAGAPSGSTESPTVSRPLTAEGAIVGTFQYMAPEQLEGREADARSDNWALGCVLYEMATGKRPFEGTSQASLIASILKETPRPIAELRPIAPPALDRVVRRCLAKDPDERFQSARDLAFELEDVPVDEAAASAEARDRAPRRRRLGRAAIAGTGIAAAVLAAGSFLAGRLTEGGSEAPTFTRLTFQRGSIGAARFTPDGKGVLYSAAWDGAPAELFETRTDLSSGRSLDLRDVALQSVSRTGQIALRRGAEGWAWGYGSLAVASGSGSAPRDLLEDVSCADWAPDGQTLAVVRRVGGEDHLEMPPGHVLVETSGWLGDVRVSPDGGRIAFTEHSVTFDARGSVALVDAAGRKSMLTSELANVFGLAWSPDGREIWFTAETAGARQSLFAVTPEGRMRSVARFPSGVVLYDVAPDGRILLGSERVQVGIRGKSYGQDRERELGWLDFPWPRALSSDGTTLLLDDLGETAGQTYACYLRRMDGSPPVRLGEGTGCALSADGRWALAIHYGPPHRLILIPTGPGDTVFLPQGPVETYQMARWLPDGDGIVFVGAERGRPQRTWVQKRSGGPPKPVTPEGVIGTTTSPDGRWVAAVERSSSLLMCPLQGGETRPIAKLAHREEVVQWSADGRTLFVTHGGARLDVFAIDVASEERRLWKTFEVPDPAGVRIFDLVVTRDTQSYAYGYMRILDELYLAEGLK